MQQGQVIKSDHEAATRAVVLAAGQGHRLRPLTDTRPKCLIEIDGRSLLDRQIDVLRSRGIEDIIVLGGYRAKQLPTDRATVAVNKRYAETNMLWTLFTVEELLQAPLIVAYGDIIYSARVLDSLLASQADVSVVIDSDWLTYWRQRNEDPISDAETLRYRSDGALAEIGGRPRGLDEIEGQYIGLMKFSQEGLAALKQHYHKAIAQPGLLGRPLEQSYMTDMLQSLIAHDIVVSPVTVQAGWAEIDTLGDVPIAQQRWREFHHE
jgi:choline kinase